MIQLITLHSKAYQSITLGLGLGSFLVFCNLYYFQPLLPYFMAEYNATATKVNWLFSSTTFTVAISLLPWAIISESYGRRPVMLCSLVSIPLVNLLMFFSQDLYHLIFFRTLLGISLAGFIAVAIAYMAEELEPKALVLAIGGYISANTLGGITGRIYGGIMTDFLGLKWTILTMSMLSLIILVVVFPLIVKQQNFKPQRGQFFYHNRQILTHLKTPKIFLAMLIGAFNFAVFINVFTVMGFRLSAAPISLPASITSLIFLCYLTGTLTAKLSGHWSKHYSVFSGIFLGVIICFLALLILFLPSFFAIILGLLLLSSGAFFIHSLAYAHVGKNAQQGKSTATALYLVMYYSGGSIGGFVLITCWQMNGWLMVFSASTLAYFIITLLTYSLSKK